MDVYHLEVEQEFRPHAHVEKILGNYADGDVTVACWEPGQASPDHAHPQAVEIYFCHSGGGSMTTDETTVELIPGGFVVHPPGEFHQFRNGSRRTLLFRVRYGPDLGMVER